MFEITHTSYIFILHCILGGDAVKDYVSTEIRFDTKNPLFTFCFLITRSWRWFQSILFIDCASGSYYSGNPSAVDVVCSSFWSSNVTMCQTVTGDTCGYMYIQTDSGYVGTSWTIYIYIYILTLWTWLSLPFHPLNSNIWNVDTEFLYHNSCKRVSQEIHCSSI